MIELLKFITESAVNFIVLFIFISLVGFILISMVTAFKPIQFVKNTIIHKEEVKEENTDGN